MDEGMEPIPEFQNVIRSIFGIMVFVAAEGRIGAKRG